ncbi:MAG: transcriptional regulator with PAS, ATPase and Fis domain [Arenicella sp.]|jgi:transcriptional regulator with PAS, ATPase and Fis domain
MKNEERDELAVELALANKERDEHAAALNVVRQENQKQAAELKLVNKAQSLEHKFSSYRSEMERIAKELTGLMQTANASIFAIDAHGKVDEWNQQAENSTGYTKTEVMGKDLVANFIAK